MLAGFLAGGLVCVATGLIDIAAASMGMESLLKPFRNAEYAYLTNASLTGGVRRVVGFTAEASAYGPICVQFASAIVLLRTVYAEGRERLVVTLVAVGLIVLALLSTSSTAYAGLAVLALVYVANWMRRAVFTSRLEQSEIVGELLVGLALLVTLLFLLIVREDLFNPLFNIVDEVILKKPMTASYYERSHWNAVAWDSIFSTWGLGIGFGSTRTSSWFAAVLSNAGLIGAAFMGVFFVQTFARGSISRTRMSRELLFALKLSVLPALTMVGIDSPGPDFGPWMGVVFGAITGIAALRPVRSSIGHAAADRPMTARTAGRRAIGSRTFGRFPLPKPHQDSGPHKPAPRPLS